LAASSFGRIARAGITAIMRKASTKRKCNYKLQMLTVCWEMVCALQSKKMLWATRPFSSHEPFFCWRCSCRQPRWIPLSTKTSRNLESLLCLLCLILARAHPSASPRSWLLTCQQSTNMLVMLPSHEGNCSKPVTEPYPTSECR